MIGTSATLGGPGGIATYTASLCEQLAANGDSPIVIAPPPILGHSWTSHGALAEILLGADVDPVRAVDAIHAASAKWDCRGVVNNDHPYVQASAPTSKIPFISVCHLDAFAIGALAAANWRYVDHVVAISLDMKRNLASRYKVPADRIQLVHTGIIPPPSKGTLSVRRQGSIFLGGGNFRKGADLVERLATILMQRGSAEKILWFGAVSTAMRRRLAHQRNIELLGHRQRSEVLTALSTSRYLLFPSRQEGCPMGLLEGMAQGAIPICAAGQGAMREIVAAGDTGFLLPLEEWPERAAHLISNVEPNAAALSFNAKARVEQAFTMDHVAERLNELLRRPTVPRPAAAHAKSIRWHRRTRPGVLGYLDRARFRFGVLRWTRRQAPSQ